MSEHVPRAVAWSLTYLLAYTSGGAIVPFLVATRSLRIHASATRVRLRGADPAPMAAFERATRQMLDPRQSPAN